MPFFVHSFSQHACAIGLLIGLRVHFFRVHFFELIDIEPLSSERASRILLVRTPLLPQAGFLPACFLLVFALQSIRALSISTRSRLERVRVPRSCVLFLACLRQIHVLLGRRALVPNRHSGPVDCSFSFNSLSVATTSRWTPPRRWWCRKTWVPFATRTGTFLRGRWVRSGFSIGARGVLCSLCWSVVCASQMSRFWVLEMRGSRPM